MVSLVIRNIRTQYIVVFVLGVSFLALGLYGVYHAYATGFTGSMSSSLLPHASLGSIAVGFLMIGISFKIVIPPKKQQHTKKEIE